MQRIKTCRRANLSPVDFCDFYSEIPALVGAGIYFKIPKLYYNYHTLESIFVDTDTGYVMSVSVASVYPTMKSATNPYMFSVGGTNVTGTSGQNIDDLLRNTRSVMIIHLDR